MKRYLLEGLEIRRLLSAVSWDGGGDGTNWTDPNNWSNNALPTSADDVTINVLGSPSIVMTGNQNIRSLSNAESLTIPANSSVGYSTLTLNGGGGSNSGTITLDAANGYYPTVSLDSSTFTNNGTIAATGSAGSNFYINLGSGTFMNSATLPSGTKPSSSVAATDT